ncbi:MAG: hypothetical protein LBC82_00830 [Oscillospiraceae bacterium]|jgi:uncharacterized membrane protein YphA (DoxX/SURF4 family)|nr:hypothetical protein [Oscillospiraceae bacterium]
MKAAKITVRVLVILLTSVWGFFFGILAPIVLMNGDLEVSSHYIMKVWLVAAIAGYFVPCFLIMLGRAKIAACFAIAGTALTLFIHVILEPITVENASFMYLPQIFITILIILYVFITNPHYISDIKQKRYERLNAPAPSILSKHEKEK